MIQKHTKASDVHWDLMLEVGDSLQTYRLDKSPCQLLYTTAKAERIFDHPLKFLTYQGAVNKGQGSVEIADAGTYERISESQNVIELNLMGQTIKAKLGLIHIEGDLWQLSIMP